MLSRYLYINLLTDELQTMWKLDFNVWCADDGTLVGRFPEIAEAVRILRTNGVAIGYHLEEDKSKRWWLTVDVTLLDDFPFELIDEE